MFSFCDGVGWTKDVNVTVWVGGSGVKGVEYLTSKDIRVAFKNVNFTMQNQNVSRDLFLLLRKYTHMNH